MCTVLASISGPWKRGHGIHRLHMRRLYSVKRSVNYRSITTECIYGTWLASRLDSRPQKHGKKVLTNLLEYLDPQDSGGAQTVYTRRPGIKATTLCVCTYACLWSVSGQVKKVIVVRSCN